MTTDQIIILIFIAYIFFINILSYTLYNKNTLRRESKSKEINPIILLLLPILGGSLGAINTIYITKYKISTNKLILIWITFILYVILTVFMIIKFSF